MLERLISSKTAEKKPALMIFIGLLYGSLSMILVHLFFKGDKILSNFSGLLVVLFCVIFSLPYIYFAIKREEKEDEEVYGIYSVWKVHKDAIFAFMFLFLGFVISFSLWNMILKDPNLLNAQIQTYCNINNPGDIEGCVSKYSLTGNIISGSSLDQQSRLMLIIGNNFGVMIFTLIFSLIFGAGAIFILAWNASVIAAAISIFTNHNVSGIPLGLGRYMIHGFPEIAAYFIAALAGGILGIGLVRNGLTNRRFMKVFMNVLFLILIAMIILLIAGVMEVYLTPILFK
ncbi:stage II sporulation protein M [Candidatus Woesearchaeota archaeon]|nr:stage II sporulation protein M [Candidatus Woesearchaeota archaeon]